jgi:hypothetical protein
MKKAEAEKVIRHLCHDWGREMKIPIPSTYPDQASFSAFTAWLEEKGYSRYLDFRSRMSARYDAERWFDEEFGQTWAN